MISSPSDDYLVIQIWERGARKVFCPQERSFLGWGEFFYFLAKRGWGEWPTLDFLGFFGLSGRCARQQGETLVVGYKWTVAGLSRPFIWLFIWRTWKTDYYISLLDSDKIVTFERKISGRYKLKGGVFKNRSYSVDGFGVEARPAHKLSFHELVVTVTSVTGRRIKELDPTTATRQIYPLVSNQDVLYLCWRSRSNVWWTFTCMLIVH